MSTITLNQDLYVIHMPGGGFSCLGFDVAFNRALAYARELKRPDLEPAPENRGTLAGIADYERAVGATLAENFRSGRRLESDLTPQLIGLEGRRVEVTDRYGETRRFWVGRSCGPIPCHLEIKRRGSRGGEAVTGTPFGSVRVVSEVRR